METYGNPNLLHPNGCQYIDYSSTSEASAALDVKTVAVELLATSDCWVVIGQQGETPTAAAPGAEKTRAQVVKLIADVEKTLPIPIGTADNPIKIGVIRDTADGQLVIQERRP